VREAHDNRQHWFAVIQTGVRVIAAVTFMFWIYRASRNARALGAKEMKYSPGWSVGWFFVPVAELFMPYLVMRELWKASSPVARGQWQQSTVSPVLGAWWAMTVVKAHFHFSARQVMLNDSRIGDHYIFDPLGSFHIDWLQTDVWGLLAQDITGVATSVLTVIVLVSIQRMQEQKRQMMVEQETSELEQFV